MDEQKKAQVKIELDRLVIKGLYREISDCLDKQYLDAVADALSNEELSMFDKLEAILDFRKKVQEEKTKWCEFLRIDEIEEAERKENERRKEEWDKLITPLFGGKSPFM